MQLPVKIPAYSLPFHHMGIRDFASEHSLSLGRKIVLGVCLNAETLNTACDRLRQERMKSFARVNASRSVPYR